MSGRWLWVCSCSARAACRTTDSTALAGSDYHPTSNAVQFAPGESSKTVQVAVIGDLVGEKPEHFWLDLVSANGAQIGTVVEAPRSSTTIRRVCGSAMSA